MFGNWFQPLLSDEETGKELAPAQDMHCLRCKGVMESQGTQRLVIVQTDGQVAPGLNTGTCTYDIYRCERCGRIELFEFRPGQKIALPTDVTCVQCGTTITPDLDACPECGWPWDEDNGSEEQP